MHLNSESLGKWFTDQGDYTHNINYDLDENSIIMDLGGYKGAWAQQIIDKYNPNVYIIEPVTAFCDFMVDLFSENEKVKILNCGVSDNNKEGSIYMAGDATSSTLSTGTAINTSFYTIDSILEKFNLNEVDLLQINIEGDEYVLLENMLKTGSINKFKNIQVQFHLGVENDVFRRDKIREGFILNGFTNKFNYPFVWESWQK
jgi:FkbM family methyltransferase